MARKNKILVPEAREGLNQLKAKVSGAKNPDEAKFEISEEAGVPLKKGYNGNLTAHQAGKIGGNIGGSMVRELVKMAEQSLAKKQQR